MSQCSITFDNNPSGVYFSGQLVSGTAILTTKKTKTIRGIYILVQGAAKVRWTESRGKSSVTYSGLEQYFYSKTYVVGGHEGDSTDYPAGTGTFKFQCILPKELPSSFTGEHGSIAYSVQLIIERPWRFDNKFLQPFIVVSVLDLNLYSGLKMPVNVEKMVNFIGLNCKSKVLKLTYEMPVRGYVSEQSVPFTLAVENNTSFDCHSARIEIKDYVEFTSQSPSVKSRKESRKIAETVLGPIPSESNRRFKGAIRLPALSSSTFNKCKIISHYYMVVVTVNTPFYRRKVRFDTPLIIGTVPFRDMQGEDNATMGQSRSPISYVTYVGGAAAHGDRRHGTTLNSCQALDPDLNEDDGGFLSHSAFVKRSSYS